MRATRPFDDGRLLSLQHALCEDLSGLFAALGCSFVRCGRAWTGPCPVHGGDNPQGVRVYEGGDEVPGVWACYTRHCERQYQKTVLGLVRGALSRRAGRDVGFRAAVRFACELLGTDFAALPAAGAGGAALCRQASALCPEAPAAAGRLTRRDVRRRLEVPADYYLKRGYSAAVLDRYDVGTCREEGRPFFGRAVFPVYDEALRLVGGTARSPYEKCPCCKAHHGGDCPARPGPDHAKWRDDGLPAHRHLYNWWYARRQIAREGVAVLTEGPGDVLRLAEAGVEVGLACFGNSLSAPQQVLLECSGATTVLLPAHDDEGGRSMVADVRAKLGRLFRLEAVALGAKDLGEMAPPAVSAVMQGPLDRARKDHERR